MEASGVRLRSTWRLHRSLKDLTYSSDRQAIVKQGHSNLISYAFLGLGAPRGKDTLSFSSLYPIMRTTLPPAFCFSACTIRCSASFGNEMTARREDAYSVKVGDSQAKWQMRTRRLNSKLHPKLH